MTDLRKIASEVFEGREEAEKRIAKGEAKNRILEDYVKEILKIFKISNSSKDSTVLVWQVRLVNLKPKRGMSEKERRFCFPMISFEQEDNAQFYNTLVFTNSLGDNTELVEHIEKTEIPKKFFGEIYDYFKENLAEYFETTKPDSEHIIIKLKSKK